MPSRRTVTAEAHDASIVEIAFVLTTSLLLTAVVGLAIWLSFSALGLQTNERILEVALLTVLVGRTAFVLRRYDRSQRRTEE